jgi:hypothetical protein
MLGDRRAGAAEHAAHVNAAAENAILCHAERGVMSVAALRRYYADRRIENSSAPFAAMI